MGLSGKRVLVVDPSETLSASWVALLEAEGLTVDIRNRPGKGLEALLLGAVTPSPHALVVLAPSVPPSMRDAFGHTLVGALAHCRLVVVDDTPSAPDLPAPTPHGAVVHVHAAQRQLVHACTLALETPAPPPAALRSQAPAAPRVAAPPRPTPAPAPVGTSSLRVLLVEDNPVNQEVAEAAMAQAGMHVVAVFNGQQAVDAVQVATYDIVVMDIQMPVMDGLTATRTIRALHNPVSRIPIIALTANAMPVHRRAAADAGMNGFVAKPISAPVLIAAIQEAVRGPSAAPAPPRVEEASQPPILDLTVLAELKSTFGPALARVHATLNRDAPQRMERMRSAAQKRDWEGMGREAHSLKSSSGTFGLMRVSQLSKTIEFACIRGDGDTAERTLATLADVVNADLRVLAQNMS